MERRSNLIILCGFFIDLAEQLQRRHQAQESREVCSQDTTRAAAVFVEALCRSLLPTEFILFALPNRRNVVCDRRITVHGVVARKHVLLSKLQNIALNGTIFNALSAVTHGQVLCLEL